MAPNLYVNGFDILWIFLGFCGNALKGVLKNPDNLLNY